VAEHWETLPIQENLKKGEVNRSRNGLVMTRKRRVGGKKRLGYPILFELAKEAAYVAACRKEKGPHFQ